MFGRGQINIVLTNNNPIVWLHYANQPLKWPNKQIDKQDPDLV